MSENIKDCWEELLYATKKLFKDDPVYTRKIKMQFAKNKREEGNSISIFIDSKDFLNRYFTNPNEKKDNSYCCWEIFLHEDGTWNIS